MAVINPLDIEYIFINTLAGSPVIFTFLSMIVIAGLAAYFRMPNTIALVMFGLFAIIMSGYVGSIYALVIIVAGLVAFYSISKLAKS